MKNILILFSLLFSLHTHVEAQVKGRRAPTAPTGSKPAAVNNHSTTAKGKTPGLKVAKDGGKPTIPQKNADSKTPGGSIIVDDGKGTIPRSTDEARREAEWQQNLRRFQERTGKGATAEEAERLRRETEENQRLEQQKAKQRTQEQLKMRGKTRESEELRKEKEKDNQLL